MGDCQISDERERWKGQWGDYVADGSASEQAMVVVGNERDGRPARLLDAFVTSCPTWQMTPFDRRPHPRTWPTPPISLLPV